MISLSGFMKKIQHHRELKIFQRSYDASLEIYKISKKFPKEEKFGLTSQIRRSATSVCANIAEGHGRQETSNKEFKKFLVFSQGSCKETTVWIDYAKDLGFIKKDKWEILSTEYEEISKMINGFIKQLKL